METLRGKIQVLEKKWYPEVIRWIQHAKVVMDPGPCKTCGHLSGKEYGSQKFGWPDQTQYLPMDIDEFDLLRGTPSSQLKLLQCPECKTYYFYRSIYEYFVNGGEDDETLTRITEKEAKKYLRQNEWW